MKDKKGQMARPLLVQRPHLRLRVGFKRKHPLICPQMPLTVAIG